AGPARVRGGGSGRMSETMLSRRSPPARAAWAICRALLILAVSGLVGATLIRFAPGFGISEQELDPRLSAGSLEALRREHSTGQDLPAFYIGYLGGLVRGDAGQSTLYGQPVSALVRERLPLTLRTVGVGLALGWSLALSLGAASALMRRTGVLLGSLAISGTLLSVPSAVIATVCLVAGFPPGAAIAAVVFPRVFPHVYEQLRAALVRPHVLMARAGGLSRTRVFALHVVPTALAPIAALAGVSMALAFGASIPIEALADSAGIGQLAWRAALGRDLPILVTVTLLLTAVTVMANLLADVAAARPAGRAS
ncbi:MAG: ABC transporter permease, partial [Bryobacteraceae bacterium]|nr:ABC transporter permease [Bryobacteraceae bacterium]